MIKKQKAGDKQQEHQTDYLLKSIEFSALTQVFFLAHGAEISATDHKLLADIIPHSLTLHQGSFSSQSAASHFPRVEVRRIAADLLLSCPCPAPKKTLCSHQAQVLYAIKNRKEFRLFFDDKLRHEEIRKVATSYGLEEVANPDSFFELQYTPEGEVEIKPILKGLVPVQQYSSSFVQEQLICGQKVPAIESTQPTGHSTPIVVLGKHRFYHHLYIELFEAQTTREGKVKNPLSSLSPLDLIWHTKKEEELKFYTAISKFQNSYQAEASESDIEGLKALVKNPLKLPFFYHNPVVSANISANSLVPVQLKYLRPDLRLSVDQKGDFYELSGQLQIADTFYGLEKVSIRYHFFIQISDVLYLVDELPILRVIEFLKQFPPTMLVHRSRFEEFRQNVLDPLAHKIRIHYSYVRPATKKQLKETGFDEPVGQLIYLSDSAQYVRITPVMRYGNVEVPVLSRKQIYASDRKGNPFTVERDEVAELAFVACLLQQHPHFQEQLHLDYFYLHKDRFLQEDWFMKVFEKWRNQHISILGFNQLSNNRINQHQAKVSIILSNGVDWFDTHIEVQYGLQKVSLKHLHQSLRNKSRFVELGDGTQGILPREWIEKFTKFFQAGEIVEDSLRTPKVNFTGIREMYEEEMLSPEAKEQLALYGEKLAGFEAIKELKVPAELKASLREYQKQGLNWLNFLDEFNFGGCLADDMGLGKTIQIIAFILSQRSKQKQKQPQKQKQTQQLQKQDQQGNQTQKQPQSQSQQQHNVNLVIVPTTLIFNWQEELAKFAPSIKILSLYGPGRSKDLKDFDGHEIVLTSYGTLLSDIRLLKRYRFNYIFLDESQAIKNPESQRYKAVRLLQSRNKIVLTGTPMENNTFDIFGQLSFACPGLLGSKQHFKGQYSDPIDKFKDSKKARELQQKISPFILRRSKEQVAKELPDKTEMTIYCEMGSAQRNVYNSYAKEYRDFLLTKEDGEISKHSLHVLQGLTKLRQICNSPSLLNDSQFYGDSSAKVEALMEQIENKSKGHKILVFSQFVAMIDLIKKELIDRNITFEYLTGKTRNRKARVEHFQNNPDVRVFLISLKAGGTGLNLTASDYVYLVDPWWNPAVENQAIDRVYRIGQKKNVVAVRLICPDTIEEKIMKLQASKKELAGDLIKTDGSMMNSFSKKDLMELFA